MRPEHYQDINKALLQRLDTKNEISGIETWDFWNGFQHL